MLAKFETKSSRVKGISFHPTRPWLLCSLHDGQIQLWDYRVGTLLETFSEHDGPVRSVDFHSSQPLFVSGGDDYKIRVWNYNNKRSLFSLMGHLDYIRTVQFHTENPWIVSCSDDQNIRIWNWQSRECIAILTGHNHYVMSAQFHPKEDLVVSASLDQTIRVWDISGLKQKGKKGPSNSNAPSGVIGRLSTDLVGTVKYVLEGHEKGVNWASFHPELPLIVSGSDDKTIRIWRTNESRAWEVDTLRGHSGNVSCVMFHPREDLILSNSEDHSIRVWDSTKRIGIQSFVRAHDRFWIITAHKTQNLLAAGHDSGTVVFKLRRERTPFAFCKNFCFYVKDRYYRIREIDGAARDIVLMPVTKGPAATNAAPRSLQFNTYCTNEFMLLMHNEEDGGSYELITCSPKMDASKITPEVRSGSASSVCFCSRNKFASLESKDMLFIRNTDNIVTKRIPITMAGCTKLFAGGCSGRVLLASDKQLSLFDTASLQVVGTVSISGVKRITWSADNSMLAAVTQHSVHMISKDMKIICFVAEKLRIKDCLWDEHGALLYSTLSQIKYILPSGEQGVVRSLDDPMYLVCIRGTTLYAFNRDNIIVKLQVDPTEYLFKLCLEKKQYKEAISIIRTSKVDSHAIISYLQRNGFEDIALYFVTEPRARFYLAIRCGNLDIAMECAATLNEDGIWTQLANEALRQGNHTMVEACYQRTKSLDKLSFLYIVTGNMEKLQKMLRIAEKCSNPMSRFYNAMYLGDVESRVHVLLDVGQTTLAYVTAVTYGLEETAASIKVMLEEHQLPIPEVNPPVSLLTPPTPVAVVGSQPLLVIPSSSFDRVMMEREVVEPVMTAEQELEEEFQSADEEETNEWEEGDLGLSDEGAAAGWGDDLDLSDEEGTVAGPVTDGLEVPQAGADVSSQWCQNSSLAYDHSAAGNVDSACQLLNRQVGAVSFTTLAGMLRSCFLSVQTATVGFPSMPALGTPMLRAASPSSLPLTVYHLQHASQLLKMGLKCFQSGRFEDAQNAFKSLLVIIPFVVAMDKAEEAELKQYLEMAREYIVAVKLEFARHEVDPNTPRSLSLSSYMTQCKLQNSHMLLALNSAMVAAFKAENFIDAAVFANRLLVNPEIKSPRNASLEQKTRKVLARSEKEGRNSVETEYDTNKVFVLDCSLLTPIYREDECIKCPFCGGIYGKSSMKKLCSVCNLAQVGVETVGLVCVNSRR